VLAGGGTDVVLASPIILYDQPEVAPESAGALFDSTEIDEILTLRVMTLTDEEKAAARATDPHAAAIIDRCDRLTPPNSSACTASCATRGRDRRALPRRFPGHPSCAPSTPATTRTCLVGSRGRRLGRPGQRRRARARGRGAPRQPRPAASDPPGRRAGHVRGRADRPRPPSCPMSTVRSHVAVVLADDPAADLHEWYGRYLYFAPDELEPMRGPS
jgi:hypothetical protein